MKYYMPPEADEFLHLVKEEFARSFDIEESFISDWLKHHNESKGKNFIRKNFF